jgi:hypothetical protein
MKTLQHKFVNEIPTALEQGILYISMEYSTAIHLCVCGCGNEVVTPFSPTDWKITFDGETVSLEPSIGNWNFPCQSHYYINHNVIKMSRGWSHEEVDWGREKDRKRKKKFFTKKNTKRKKNKDKE